MSLVSIIIYLVAAYAIEYVFVLAIMTPLILYFEPEPEVAEGGAMPVSVVYKILALCGLLALYFEVI